MSAISMRSFYNQVTSSDEYATENSGVNGKSLASTFTKVLHYCHIDASNLSIKLKIAEIELVKFLTGDLNSLQSVHEIIRKWIENFGRWLHSYPERSVKELSRITISEIMNFDEDCTKKSNNNTPKMKKNLCKVKGLTGITLWKFLFIGDLLEIRDEINKGVWKVYKVVDLDSQNLELASIDSDCSIRLYISSISNSVRIPHSTLDEIRRRKHISISIL